MAREPKPTYEPGPFVADDVRDDDVFSADKLDAKANPPSAALRSFFTRLFHRIGGHPTGVGHSGEVATPPGSLAAFYSRCSRQLAALAGLKSTETVHRFAHARNVNRRS